jgi:putative spermidine/putrescine transport system substrate-binding protein
MPIMKRKSARRSLSVVVIAIVAVLTGCTGAGQAAGSMVYVGPGGSYQNAETKAYIDPFSQSTGIDVQQDSPLSYPKLKAMVDAKDVTWDVMEGYPYFAEQNCGTYLEKLNFKDIDTTGVDKNLITPCSVPAMKSAIILIYNTAKYGANPPKSWQDFFDTKRFPGKRGIMNDVNQGVLEAALLADGVAPKNLYPIDYNRAFAKLNTIRGDLDFIATGADQEQAMATGQVDMMIGWPGRAYDAVVHGAHLAPVWNQAIFYSDAFMVPKGTKHLDEAMKFLSWAIKAQSQANLTENIAYAPINANAHPNVSTQEQDYLPHGQDNGTGFWRDEKWWADNLDDATQRWTQWAAS